MYSVTCLLSPCAPPRHLHSFPTRRSSDLCSAAPRCVLLDGARAEQTEGRHTGRRGEMHQARVVADEQRSEEHTSELQSRPHLVCRLLLEKKKKSRRRD